VRDFAAGHSQGKGPKGRSLKPEGRGRKPRRGWGSSRPSSGLMISFTGKGLFWTKSVKSALTRVLSLQANHAGYVLKRRPRSDPLQAGQLADLRQFYRHMTPLFNHLIKHRRLFQLDIFIQQMWLNSETPAHTSIFTTLHGTQTRSCDEISVRPSVRLSSACIVTKPKKSQSRFLYHAIDNLV